MHLCKYSVGVQRQLLGNARSKRKKCNKDKCLAKLITRSNQKIYNSVMGVMIQCESETEKLDTSMLIKRERDEDDVDVSWS
jgi:hypothetical protein